MPCYSVIRFMYELLKPGKLPVLEQLHSYFHTFIVELVQLGPLEVKKEVRPNRPPSPTSKNNCF